MKFRKLSLLLGLASSLAMCTPFLPSSVSAENEEPIFADDFESETINGWSVLGGVGEMTVDTSRKQSGNSSLRITGREHTFNGPSISLDYFVESEETYRFTGWIYNDSSETESINCTLRFSDSVNVDSYMGVATIEAKPSEWTYFEGTVDTPEDLSSTLLYFEAQNETLDFNIDDIRLYGKAPEAAANPEGAAESSEAVEKYVFDFENGFDEWISRGDTRLIRTDEQQKSGNYSMLSTNRVKVWNGPSVSVDGIQRETEYTYSANVLYTDKKADPSHEILLQLQYSYNGNETYAFIASAEAQKNVWTEISGVYTVPEGATNVMLYLQTANLEEGADPSTATHTDLVSFYVDDVSAIRSDLVGKTDLKAVFENMSTTALLIIIAAIIVLAVLIIVIVRLRAGSETDSSQDGNGEAGEGANAVIDALDGKNEEKAETPEKKPAEDKKSSEGNTETKKENSQKNGNKKNNGSKKNNGGKNSNSSKNNNSSKVKSEEKSENSTEKKTEDKTSPEKETKQENKDKKKNDAEDSRSEEVFGIETFSYDDPDAATASRGESDENPDSPFDGF